MPPSLSNTPSGNQNTFFGQKVSIPGINVNNAADNQLVYKNDYSAQTFYSGGNIAMALGKLSTGGYGITIPTNNGTLNLGQLPDGKLGMNTVNASGNTLFEMVGQTWTWYDTSGNVVMYVGLLPVANVFGWAVATPGNSLLGVV